MSAHRCFACDQLNPESIVTAADDGWIFEFVERFAGPQGRAHGGTAVGALTCPALQLAERDGMLHPVALHVNGRLNLPVPQSKPIRVSAHKERGRYQFKLYDESKLVLDGFVEVGDQETEIGSELQEPPPERVEDLKILSELADVEVKGSTLWTRLRQSFEAAGIPWTGGKCFGCSETESALKLRHRVAGQGLTWTRWKGEPKFTDGSGRLATTIVAAAIDCANLHAVTAEDPEFVMQLLRDKKLWVTGTYGVRFLRVPPVDIGGDYRVAARYLGRDGRKLFTMSALLDREGTVYAIGETVAIIFDFQAGMMGT